ncbi:DUF2157 domain-containing protein [Deinococcus cellulosilyticus]|uniref:DUF2157 domain-containing protein n=1 Tax=Deinococcus cellulosilyticus (strain DSM 18568 / NBRC 106333 / KACC 11606 / 5516J-15) TaxID=1223518 RepID=A0A511N7W2_DEIC1|nr:DUF2157 domain-containing protein [Deinococcus cellulosilyticus]GEM48924.1 hypothetical protein DC3_45590 [Deinococcus cellulosilyticus NBRC 106333 = KACC 11606]
MKRPLSTAQRQWLLAELRVWQEKDILQGEQARAILDLYPQEAEMQSARQSRVFVVLWTFGMLFLGAAILAVVAFNWAVVPAAVRVLLVLLGLGASHILAARSSGVMSDVWSLLANLVMGAGIWVIAQTFQMSMDTSIGQLLWMLGILFTLLQARSSLNHFLLIGIFAAMFYYGDSGQTPAVLLGGLLLIPSVVWAHRKPAPGLFNGLMVALVYWMYWGLATLGQYALLLPLGAGLLLLGENLRPSIFRVLGWSVLIIMTTLMGTVSDMRGQTAIGWTLHGVLILLPLAYVVWSRPAAVPWSRYTLPVLLLLLTPLYGLLGRDGTVILSLVFTLLLGYHLTVRGIQEDLGWMFSLGAITLVLTLLYRSYGYLEPFGDGGWILMMLVVSAIFIALALYWRRRKSS